MQLFWHGYSSIRIEAKIEDQDVTLMTDPYENEASLRFPRTASPDVLLLSHQDRKKFNLEAVQGTPFIISDPGEFEVKNLFVYAIQDPAIDSGTKNRQMIYKCMVEGMSVVFLGQLKRKLTDMELEVVGSVDILVIPVGGGDVMDGKMATAVIADIEPRVVVPINFDIPGIKAPLADVNSFCKNLSGCKRQDANKLKIAKKDLPAEDLLVVVLERA